MKEQILILIAAAMTCAATAAFEEPTPTPNASPPAERAQRYTCPMHPEIVRAEPGQCPKCGMTLVPVKESKRSTSNAQRPTSKSEHAKHNADGMAMPEHQQEEHAEHAHEMSMHSSINVADPMNREGSGTSW